MSVEVIHEADIQAMKDEIERLNHTIAEKDYAIQELKHLIHVLEDEKFERFISSRSRDDVI